MTSHGGDTEDDGHKWQPSQAMGSFSWKLPNSRGASYLNGLVQLSPCLRSVPGQRESVVSVQVDEDSYVLSALFLLKCLVLDQTLE